MTRKEYDDLKILVSRLQAHSEMLCKQLDDVKQLLVRSWYNQPDEQSIKSIPIDADLLFLTKIPNV